jgi:dipeptidyl aminopeptidase/acylaminoacyl peptidase
MDNTISQGILYKPENFDPTKKYPLVVNFYWQFSQKVNEFIHPDYAFNGLLNVPWFVNRGYLVFMPDIYFTKDRTRGASALNTVEGAVGHFSKLPYIDSNRLGIAGHSRSGAYTNYIITRTSRFAAALAGAGASDWISSALQISIIDGESRLGIQERSNNFSAGIWDPIYLQGNPILHVNKITSPLLIMHNKLDGGVPWEQAVELFVAMRRLNKKVWMLQYDKEEHQILERKNYLDFTVRVTQYFDHYLKGAPAPRWMTTGIPAKLKRIETGLELNDKIDSTTNK